MTANKILKHIINGYIPSINLDILLKLGFDMTKECKINYNIKKAHFRLYQLLQRRKSPAAKSRARNERRFLLSECICLVMCVLLVLSNHSLILNKLGDFHL